MFHTKTLFITLFKKSNLTLTKHLPEVLVIYVNLKKSAAESYRMLMEVYGSLAPTDNSCREWLLIFKYGDLSFEDKPRSGQSKKIRR